MRKRIGIFGASEEALGLIPLLAANPTVEISAIVDERPEALAAKLPHLERSLAALIQPVLTADSESLTGDPHLHAVVDASPGADFAQRFPEIVDRGVQIVTPLTARLLWGYGVSADDHKGELLHALHEVVESYNLTVDPDELFTRMLEIALGVTGAEGGSVMLLDEAAGELRVRVAVGVEPELWPKIRVPLGEGIAGRVAAEARPIRLRGKADRQAFRIVRERLDVESALCVPLVHDGRVLGVLNLHHGSRPDAFSDADLEFADQLAKLDANIIARSQEHETLRSQATRYAAVRDVHAILSSKAPLNARLARLCEFVAERAGGGIATVYLRDPDDDTLRMAATSLEGGGFGGEYRVAIGEGIDGGVAQSGEPAFLRRPDGGLAYAALPLVAGDLMAGVLSIQAGRSAPAGRAGEVTLLEIAAAAAEEISQAERETRMAARATKVSAINEVGIRMASTEDPADVLRLGASSAAMVLEADHAVLRLQDDETRRFVIRSYFGSADGRLQEKLFRLDKQVSVDVLKRRAPLLVRDVDDHESIRGFGAQVRSLMAAPLKRDGHVIGTLALYDKVPHDRFLPANFGEGDVELFARFVSYLERAIANAISNSHARQHRNFDEETGLPNTSYLSKRIQEEIARAGPREGSVALAVARIENLGEIEGSGDAVRARRVVERVVTALREHVRNFDVLARVDEEEFAVLMPEPGNTPSERVFTLARSVADDVSKDDRLNTPMRVALSFGYAVHPGDGGDHGELLESARQPRIRMV